MKQLGWMLSALILSLAPKPVASQWLDTTIYLGDSFYYFQNPRIFVSDPLDNKVFAAGFGVIAIDAVTFDRSCVTNAWGSVTSLCRNPTGNKIYAATSDLDNGNLYVLDAATNTILNTINCYISYISAMVYDSVNNQVFCAVGGEGGDAVYVVDGASDTIDAVISEVGNEPHALTYNTSLEKVYCAQEAFSGLAVIDAATNTFITLIPMLINHAVLTCNPVNNKVYVIEDYWSDSVFIIDCITDSIIASVPVGNQPSALAYNGVNNKIYCAAGDSLSIIDGATNSLIATISDTAGFASLYYNPVRNKIYCTHDGRPAITVVDGASNLIDTCLYLGFYPTAPVYHENTNTISCGNEENTRITMIDATTYALNAQFSAYQRFEGFAFNPADNKLYGVDFFNQVLALDGPTHAVTDTIPAGVTMNSILCNPAVNKLYCGSRDQIVVIDAIADSVIKRITYNDMPLPLFCNPDYNKLYCSYWVYPSTQSLMIVDCLGDSVIKGLDVQEPHAFCNNSTQNKIYCSHGNGTSNNKIAIIDAATDSIIRDHPDPTLVIDLVFNPTNDRIYGLGYQRVTVIDGATDAVIGTIPVQPYPSAITCNPFNNKIYCVGSNTGGLVDTLYIISGVTDSIIARLAVTRSSGDLLYNPVNNKIYCSNIENHMVTVIDGATNAIVAFLPVGIDYFTHKLELNEIQDEVYVLNSSSASVSVIRDLNLIGEYPVGPSVKPSLSVYPNPFTKQTMFFMDHTTSGSDMTLKIYDACGRLVRELYPSDRSTRPTRITWNGKDLAGRGVASGVYFARFTADGRSTNTAVLYLR